MKKPSVSVLMPVYNCAAYLDKAIQSIRGQTFTDFEFIIINDGSTDDSLAIIERHAAKDSRIIVLDRPNGGYINALNAGLEVCRGEYIARMDGDDISLPERLAVQVQFLEENPDCGLVGSSVDLIDSTGKVTGSHEMPTTHDAIIQHCIGHGSCAIFHPTWLARKELYELSNGYDEAYYGAEDVALLLLHQDQLRFANLPERLVQYRRHDNAVGVRLNVKQVRSGELAVRRSAEKFKNVSRRTLSDHAYRASWTCSDKGLHWLAMKYALRSWRNAPYSLLGAKAMTRSFWKFFFDRKQRI